MRMAKSHRIVYAFIAFDDIELLERKIKYLYTREDYFIVHWNKSSSRKKLHQLQRVFKDMPNVYIYSKIKVMWGMHSILLALIENMCCALKLAGNFDHLIMLSEQCVPVKTKEYIKAHLAHHAGESFCGCDHIIAEVSLAGTPCKADAFLLTGYFFGLTCYKRLSPAARLKMFMYGAADFFYYLIPILKNSKQIWHEMKQARSFRALSGCSGIKKIIALMKYIVLFPLRFILISLERFDCVSRYAKPSKLLSVCKNKTFQKTKSAGPAGCYCYDDVQYLCRLENIELAKSMRRYFSSEEYFCQTMLYNSETQNKNFLNESLCATDYTIKKFEDLMPYLDEREFRDFTESSCTPREYKFQHICFVRKVADKEIYSMLESHLLKQSP